MRDYDARFESQPITTPSETHSDQLGVGFTGRYVLHVKTTHSMLDQSSRSGDDTIRALLCLIEGNYAIFEVPIAINKITHLKRVIYQEGKNRVLSNIDSNDLSLLKVTTTPSPAISD